MTLESLLNPEVVSDPIVTPTVESRVEFEFPDYILYDPEIVGYPNTVVQDNIYNWAIEGILTAQNVCDIGSGRGDFYRHFQKINQAVDYIGFELMTSLVTAGNKRTTDDHFKNYLGDYLELDAPTVDYTFCIGSLNMKNDLDKWDYLNKIFERAMSHTNIAAVFILNRIDEEENMQGFPLEELFSRVDMLKTVPFVLDYSKMENIYKLTVYSIT